MGMVVKDYRYEDCFLKMDGPIATFVMSNPQARNAGSMKMREGFMNAIQVVRDTDDIRVLVVTGDPEGKAFCAGLNVKRLSARLEAPATGDEIVARENYTPGTAMYRMAVEDKGAFRGTEVPEKAKTLSRGRFQYWKEHSTRGGYFMDYEEALLRLPKPVIAMVNGAAVGMGADLVFHCDIIIASDQAVFSWAYIHRGMVAAEGGTFFLPRLVGYHRALEILYLGDRVTAQQANEWGMVNHLVPHDQLETYTYDLAKRLATESPPMGMAMIKYAVQRGYDDFVHSLMMHREEIVQPSNQYILMGSNDAREGNRAFVEKRKPNYTGT